MGKAGKSIAYLAEDGKRKGITWGKSAERKPLPG